MTLNIFQNFEKEDTTKNQQQFVEEKNNQQLENNKNKLSQKRQREVIQLLKCLLKNERKSPTNQKKKIKIQKNNVFVIDCIFIY